MKKVYIVPAQLEVQVMGTEYLMSGVSDFNEKLGGDGSGSGEGGGTVDGGDILSRKSNVWEEDENEEEVWQA